jgi:hypothetical protein
MAADTIPLSEAASNVIENLACRVAERRAGRIAPHHLLPYLPVSLGIVKSCLDDMADGTAVSSEVRDNIVEYEFAAYRDKPDQGGALQVATCIACDKDPPGPGDGVLCTACTNVLKKELNRLAERTGWPAQAVYEHEILFHAAEHDDPVHAETLAGKSRYTLRNMRRKLDKLTLGHFGRQELDQEAGVTKYSFPPLEYPRALYRRNMRIIRSYPASVMEEVQIKITRILLVLGLILLVMLGMAFWGIPFPMLVLLFLIVAPIVAIVIWRHKTEPLED